MNKFKLFGEAIFSAEDIDDAFKLVIEHFQAISNGGDLNLFEPGTNLSIVPVPEEEPEATIEEVPICGTCGGQGFTEENAGLVQLQCPNCEAGIEFLKSHGLPGAEDKPRELKPGEYLCTKCNKPHRANSKLGARHLKHKEG